jgi:hypothetical protein
MLGRSESCPMQRRSARYFGHDRAFRPGLRHREVLRSAFSGNPVDLLAEQVGVPGVAEVRRVAAMIAGGVARTPYLLDRWPTPAGCVEAKVATVPSRALGTATDSWAATGVRQRG